MKLLYTLLISAALLPAQGVTYSAPVIASDQPVSEPEFSDVFYKLSAGKLIPLERQTATMHGQAHGFIVMSMKTASEFPGSRLRFGLTRTAPWSL
jgi:hypothetical protein